MAHNKQAEKRIRTSDKSRLANRRVSTVMKTAVKKAIKSGIPEDHSTAVKRLDKAAKKGILHKNAVARRKSRLAKKIAGSAS